MPPSLTVDLVQGAHLVLAEPVVDHCYYLEAPSDGRAVFLLPWRDGSLLGTTETLFTGDPDAVAPLPEEEAYLARGAPPLLSHRDARGRRASGGTAGAAAIWPAPPLQRSREAQLTVRRRPQCAPLYRGLRRQTHRIPRHRGQNPATGGQDPWGRACGAPVTPLSSGCRVARVARRREGRHGTVSAAFSVYRERLNPAGGSPCPRTCPATAAPCRASRTAADTSGGCSRT